MGHAWCRVTFWQRVFGFVTAKVPLEPKGDYQTGAILMRVFGWIQAIGIAFGLLLAFILVPILFIAGVIGEAAAGGEAPVAFIMAIIAVAVVFGIVIGTAIAILWMFWIGWILEHWAAKDERGLRHARIFAIVQLALAAVGVAFLIGSTLINVAVGAYDDAPFGPGLNFIGLANPTTLIAIGGAIWLLVLAGKPGLQEVFEA